MVTELPNSLRWQAMQTLLQALHSSPALGGDGIPVIHNPRSPASLSKGAYWVFLKDQADTLLGSAGQAEKRSHQFLLGVVARSDHAERDADAVHEAAASTLRATRKLLMQANRVENLSESSTQFEAASLEIDGALCLSTWVLSYRKTSP